MMGASDRLDGAALCAVEHSRSCENFLSLLFRSLDAHEVRYCVLHSWEELPFRLSSDLDMAVHPDDVQRLPLVLGAVLRAGYTPVQLLNYFVNAYYLVFFWVENAAIHSVALDIIFEHRRGGLIVSSGASILSGRRKCSMFWIPAPESEFTYLLAKKTWKASAPPRQVLRLKTLVEQLGRPTAERLAGELFLKKLKNPVVDACGAGRIDLLLPKIKAQMWATSLWRKPGTLIAYLVSDGLRRVRRWMQPTGLFVVAMGPDGVGKSTILGHVVQAMGPAFRRQRVFHWRPGVVWGGKIATATDQPHKQQQYGAAGSIAKLVLYVIDYWVGYWFVIRPLLAKSGLVVFDRYFDDLLIDPRRYRYGGPRWLAEAVQFLIPRPDVILVMDAPAEIVLSRKQEVTPEEVQRQRVRYCQYQCGASNRHLIDAAASAPEVALGAARQLLTYLAQRFKRRHYRWIYT